MFDTFAADLLAIERRTADRVAGKFAPVFKRLLALLVLLWPDDEPKPDERATILERLNVKALEAPIPSARAELFTGTLSAWAYGVQSAADMLEVAGLPFGTPLEQGLPDDVVRMVDRLESVVAEQLKRADALMQRARTQADAQAALAVAKHGIQRAERLANFATNTAANTALTMTSHATEDVVSVWRAERTACVHCAAYAGHIDDGDGYPAGLTFGKAPLHDGPVAQPPLHPNCRCTQILVHVESAEDLARAMRREAQRSILRGWSMASEPESVRLDAAQRLLNEQPAMPKSVQAYARKAIKSGRFERGRKPPV